MTDERVKALEAVAEAARKFDRGSGYFEAVRAALAALDEYTVADAETVTLAVWQSGRGAVVLATPGGENDLPCKDWTRLGTTQITITREGGR